MTLSPANAALRGRSGAVNSTDPLVSFLYILMRDHLPAGDVEKLVREHVVTEGQDDGDESQFCNGYLAAYAQDLAQRIHPRQTLRVKVGPGCPPDEIRTLLEHMNQGLVDPDYHIVVNYPVEIEVVQTPEASAEVAQPPKPLSEQLRPIQGDLHALFAKVACACSPEARRIVNDEGRDILVMADTKVQATLTLWDNHHPDTPMHFTISNPSETPEDLTQRFLAEIQAAYGVKP